MMNSSWQGLSVLTARRALLVGLLVALLVAQAWLIRLALSRTFSSYTVGRYELPAFGVFAVLLLVLATADLPRRLLARAIVVVSVIFEVIGLLKPPVDSDDDFRYLWDAKVQLSGIDPYRYAPSSPQLAHLRDPFLFPTGVPCDHHAIPGACTNINLPLVHTIYPPVAEAMFGLLRLLSFGDRGHHFPLQLAAALGVLAVTLLLTRRALAAGSPLWPVAIWAWCPITIIELVNNAHIDWLGVLLSVVALTVAARGRYAWAGVLIGAATATKLYPGLVGTALLSRRPVVVIGSAVGTVVLVYLPHVLAVGDHVIGFLPSYLNNGGYGTGKEYRLLSFWLPSAWQTPVAVVLIAGALIFAIIRSDPDHPERAALIAVGTFTIVATPTLPWYAGLLLALAALNERPEWLGIAAAPTVEYLLVARGHEINLVTTRAYLVGLLILVAGTLLRRGFDHRQGVSARRASRLRPSANDVVASATDRSIGREPASDGARPTQRRRPPQWPSVPRVPLESRLRGRLAAQDGQPS
jgi:hypothetical protein